MGKGVPDTCGPVWTCPGPKGLGHLCVRLSTTSVLLSREGRKFLSVREPKERSSFENRYQMLPTFLKRLPPTKLKFRRRVGKKCCVQTSLTPLPYLCFDKFLVPNTRLLATVIIHSLQQIPPSLTREYIYFLVLFFIFFTSLRVQCISHETTQHKSHAYITSIPSLIGLSSCMVIYDSCFFYILYLSP